MEYALPSAWSQGSRGFWTKRKKSATSIVAILALIAGIAVAFKLFDRTVPNNVVRDASIFGYDVLVERSPAQGCTTVASGHPGYCVASAADPIYSPTQFINGQPRPHSQFPGDTRTEVVRIVNTNQNPAKDASFQMYIQNVAVDRCADFDGSGAATPGDLADDASAGDFDPDTGDCLGGTVPVPVASGDAVRFINFFSLDVDRESYIVAGGGAVEEEDPGFVGFTDSCEGGLREITKNSPCDLGSVLARGSETTVTGAPLDERDYEFAMTEADDGSDQSRFKGWRISFDFVFQARLPALPDSTFPVGIR